MNLQKIIFAILTVLMLSIGQLLFKLASEKIDLASKGLLSSLACNPYLLLALSVYGVATLAWLFVLKSVPLRVAYPFVALAFIMVPVLSSIFLHEALTVKTLVGAGLIILGVYVSIS